jgi:hypothetical protein
MVTIAEITRARKVDLIQQEDNGAAMLIAWGVAPLRGASVPRGPVDTTITPFWDLPGSGLVLAIEWEMAPIPLCLSLGFYPPVLEEVRPVVREMATTTRHWLLLSPAVRPWRGVVDVDILWRWFVAHPPVGINWLPPSVLTLVPGGTGRN